MFKQVVIPGIFIVFLFQSMMSYKFFLGFGAGAYVATIYDVKPAITYVEKTVVEKYHDFNNHLETHKNDPEEEKKDMDDLWKTVKETTSVVADTMAVVTETVSKRVTNTMNQKPKEEEKPKSKGWFS